jgi:hypothetical protein
MLAINEGVATVGLNRLVALGPLQREGARRGRAKSE